LSKIAQMVTVLRWRYIATSQDNFLTRHITSQWQPMHDYAPSTYDVLVRQLSIHHVPVRYATLHSLLTNYLKASNNYRLPSLLNRDNSSGFFLRRDTPQASAIYHTYLAQLALL